MRKSIAVLGFSLLVLALNAQVAFILDEVPPNTPDADTLFLSGAVNNWVPNHPEFAFRAAQDGLYFLTINQPALPPFEYKVTRGSWESVEASAFGQFINNRYYKGGGGGDTVRLKILSSLVNACVTRPTLLRWPRHTVRTSRRRSARPVDLRGHLVLWR